MGRGVSKGIKLPGGGTTAGVNTEKVSGGGPGECGEFLGIAASSRCGKNTVLIVIDR